MIPATNTPLTCTIDATVVHTNRLEATYQQCEALLFLQHWILAESLITSDLQRLLDYQLLAKNSAQRSTFSEESLSSNKMHFTGSNLVLLLLDASYPRPKGKFKGWA